MNKKNKIIVIIIAVITIITLGGLTYAFFSANNVQGNSTTNTIVTLTADYGNITVTYDGSNGTINASNIDLKNSEKGIDKLYLMKFYITSTANITHKVTIKWKNVINTFCQYASGQNCTDNSSDTYIGDELYYNLYTCNETNYNNATTGNISTNCTNIGTNPVPETGNSSKLTTNDYIELNPSSTSYYVLLLTLQNKVTEQNYNQGKNFTGRINVDFYVPTLVNVILETSEPVADNIASIYVTNVNGIDFNQMSSPTNGQGLYINSKSNIVNDPTAGTIKYFRGGTFCAYLNYESEVPGGTRCKAAEVGGTWDGTTYRCSLHDNKSLCESKGFTFYELKNNVMFGGFAWKILSINADGIVKMIYNGTNPTERGTSAQIGTSAFKLAPYDDNTYIGYMYGIAGSTTYAATHTNTNDSTIKMVVDTWYQNNLALYTNQIADAGFCNDRSLNSGVGYGTNTTYYKPYNRLYTNKTPTFNCPQTNDLYTTATSSIGNKALTYPIGLITADEAAYAGSKYASTTYNFVCFLQSGDIYWTQSPYFVSGSSLGFRVSSVGNMNYNHNNSGNGVRPVISLKSDTMVSGGTGTLTDPWIVS